MALTSSATSPLSFASRETGTPPRLIVETADLTLPAVTLTTPAAGSMTNQSQPSFAGAAGTAAGDLPTVTVNVYGGTVASGTPVQTLTTTAVGGAWAAAANAALAEGVYTAQAQQADDEGNVGRSSANTFTVDTTPPAVTLTSPVGGATPTFAGAAGTASGDLPAITVRIYGGTSATGTPVQVLQSQATGSSWSATATAPLPNGTYTARAEQSDARGQQRAQRGEDVRRGRAAQRRLQERGDRRCTPRLLATGRDVRPHGRRPDVQRDLGQLPERRRARASGRDRPGPEHGDRGRRSQRHGPVPQRRRA